MKILLKIKYVGTAYAGYQVQKNAPTVQEKLCEAAEKLLGFRCDITGCSRTDSGVHANMFCATVTRHGTDTIETSVPLDRLPRAMNSFLPDDIAVFGAEYVPGEFHARHDVKYKEYIYKIRFSYERDPFLCGRCWQIPRGECEDSVYRMKKAAAYFVGTHDFSSYMTSGSDVESTVRTVFYADVEKEGEIIVFRVAGDGFLYNMVRIMTGTLVEVAEGKLCPEDIPRITDAHDREKAGMTAPACGLYLNKVVYN